MEEGESVEEFLLFINEMEFIETTKGGHQIALSGYLSKKNELLLGITYWECGQRRSISGFKGWIVVNPNDQLLGQASEHTHPPDPEKIAIVKSRLTMKSE